MSDTATKKKKKDKLPKIEVNKQDEEVVPLFKEPPKSLLVIRKELATYVSTTLEESRDKNSW
jgi:hypothetical protein